MDPQGFNLEACTITITIPQLSVVQCNIPQNLVPVIAALNNKKQVFMLLFYLFVKKPKL